MKKDLKWKKVGGSFPPSFVFEKVGDSIEGVLIQKKTLKLKDGDRKVYVIQTDEGDRSVWGSGLLDHLIASVGDGSKVKIVYGGKEKVNINGKKRNCNQHEVYVLDEDEDEDEDEDGKK